MSFFDQIRNGKIDAVSIEYELNSRSNNYNLLYLTKIKDELINYINVLEKTIIDNMLFSFPNIDINELTPDDVISDHKIKMIDKYCNQHFFKNELPYTEEIYNCIYFFHYLLGKIDKFKKKENPTIKFTLEQIGLAYWFMEIPITKENYLGIIKSHNNTSKSNKILQHIIWNKTDLVGIDEIERKDKGKLKNLIKAKELIKSIKKVNYNNKNALKDIQECIDKLDHTITMRY